MVQPELIDILKEHFRLDWYGIHGISHWRRVRQIGMAIAERNGADKLVVDAFAFLHDSCRKDDKRDCGHGARAARLAARLNDIHLKLDPLRLKYLQHACAHHESGMVTENVTIGTCWDADRLDLGRVHIESDSAYLSTDVVKQTDFIAWASRLSIDVNRMVVCGSDELERYRGTGITHMIRIMNPGASPLRPTWFSGEFLALAFGDVISVADAKNFRTRAPDTGDIVAALNFCAPALSDAYGRILVSCDYGASRSPALALVIVAHQLGVGQEQVALEMILAIRPEAVPNQMVVRLGDMLLKRDGTLVSALNTLYADINQRLFK